MFGYLAEFPTAAAVYEAARRMRDAGYTKWDVHSPFPIHGMDEAMGLRRSILPYIVFFGGAAGLLTAFLLQYGTQVELYPTIVQAKPTNIYTVPAFFPVMFELTILFSAFTALFGGLALMGLPRLHHPLFNSRHFTRFSDDLFFISLEAGDPVFSKAESKRFLEEIGGRNIEAVEDEV
ncbi:MAG TPA: DUF3341 domain-containing protein [Verrucomicrobiales bacterium]|nr:DUF3341 domain-containing protein [Verrucomicrobiales bacterium]